MEVVTLLASFFVFILFLIGCFYLPGKFLIRKLRFVLAPLEDLFLSTVFGMLLFTLIMYMLGWVQAAFLAVPLLLIIDFFAIKNGSLQFGKFDKEDKAPFVFIVVLSMIFSLTMVLSGEYKENIRLIGVNNSDSMWHLALINELKAQFPPHIPTFAGLPLRGYHFFSDFLVAMFSNVSHISPIRLFFQFFPLLTALLWGNGVYVFMKRWAKDRKVALWAVFLTMFGGSFSFVLHLQGHTHLSLDDAFGITQPASALVNPPFALSIVIVLATLFAFYQYVQTRNYKWLVPIVLCVGLITMFKVYAGILMVSGLILIALIDMLKKNLPYSWRFLPF